MATIHNERMKPFFRLFTMTAAVVLLGALVGLAACGGTEGSVDPKAVLAEASAKMKLIQGFHFVYEVHKPASAEPGTGLEIGRITGDVNSKGYMQATVDATFGGVPVSIGFVALGDTHYIQDPLSQKWQTMSAAESPVGSLNLSAGTIQILDRIADTRYEGEEGKGGATTYHINGRVAAEEVKAIAGAVDTTDTFPTDIWVGKDDSYVYEVDIAGAATPNEDEKIWRSIVLSDLDTFVDIKVPQ
jgi:LppX_LprAFG lipoprotein